MGRTKTEIRDKLRELHAQVQNGVRPRRHYTANDALDDWLANGLDGLAPSTVRLYRNTIAATLRQDLGTVKLTALAAGTAQKALASLASERSTRTVQIAHNVLVRAIRHAERDGPGGAECRGASEAAEGAAGRTAVEVADPGAGGGVDGRGAGTRLEVALREHPVRQAEDRLAAGPLWRDHGLVFASAVGTPMDDNNVRRMFRAITEDAGLGTGWVPREISG